MFRRTLIAGFAAGTVLSIAGCASNVLGPVPQGKYPLLKRFKAAANKEMARLDLAYKNIDSMSMVLGGARQKAIVKDDYERLVEHHERLQKVMKEVDKVRAELDNDELRQAFEAYVKTLKAVADVPAGELTDDMILDWQTAGGNLEPLVD